MQKKLVEVCYTPRDYEYFRGRFDIVVVIDALRATSAICAAIDSGVNSIIPVSSIEEAKEYQEKGYLVGAERQGEIVEGFDLGNSPYSYMNDDLVGKDIVLTTTNGTKAIDTAKDADTLIIASFLNLDSVINWLLKQNKNVVCLCSGWQDKFNLEDTICGGAIADGLLSTGKYTSNEDSSIAAKYLFYEAKTNHFGFLKSSSHRRRLKKLKLNEDIKYCLTPNQMDIIPYYKDGKVIKMDI